MDVHWETGLIQNIPDTYKFRQVHVSQDSHDCSALTVLRIGSFVGSKSTEYRQNVSQTKIIMYLENEDHDYDL